jgi:hypothetical protein
MAIEKGIYSAPMGLDDDEMEGMEPESALEIEIIDPEAVILDDGSMEITLFPDAEPVDEAEFGANLADFMSEGDLRELSQDLVGLIEADINSRKEWVDAYVEGLDVLGFKYESAPSLGRVPAASIRRFWPKRPSGSKPKLCLRLSQRLVR